jgi:hypothetical protein
MDDQSGVLGTSHFTTSLRWPIDFMAQPQKESPMRPDAPGELGFLVVFRRIREQLMRHGPGAGSDSPGPNPLSDRRPEGRAGGSPAVPGGLQSDPLPGAGASARPGRPVDAIACRVTDRRIGVVGDPQDVDEHGGPRCPEENVRESAAPSRTFESMKT